jgi:hypothetical protein
MYNVIGHSYTAAGGQISFGYNSGTGYDALLLAAASTVPVILRRLILTASQTAAVIWPVQIFRRSAASTGGSAVVALPNSPGSPAASTTVTYGNVSSTGAAVGTSADSQEWNQFGPYEYDQRPQGLLILPATWCGIYFQAPQSAGFTGSFRVEFDEVK